VIPDLPQFPVETAVQVENEIARKSVGFGVRRAALERRRRHRRGGTAGAGEGEGAGRRTPTTTPRKQVPGRACINAVTRSTLMSA
jgi:hypothetical protein